MSFEVQTAGGSLQLAAAPPDPELGLALSYRGWSGAGSAPQSSEGLTPCPVPRGEEDLVGHKAGLTALSSSLVGSSERPHQDAHLGD